jgi:predicted PolB exonuclease-like 3'-5' exonuclease
MKIATIDIETIPNQRIPELCKPCFDPDEIKTGNIKDPAKIAAKIQEAKESFESDIIKKMSVTPSLAQLCTFVGIQYDTTTEEVINKTSIQVTKEYDADDYDAVSEGWQFIRMAHNSKIPIVSFNGIGFDLPVLWHRAIAQDIPVDQRMYARVTPRYGGYLHYDLLGLLAGWTLDKMKGHNLEFFLNLYGIGTKGGMDGSKVYEAWQLGEYNKIQQYCESDVLQTCKLFQRVESWVSIEKEDYEHGNSITS